MQNLFSVSITPILDCMKVNKTKPISRKVKDISLALQGGGSHGAFTWGVLERLLEEDSINITEITATSAGAMNAVILNYGFSKGGKELAKKLLESFWKKISFISALSPVQPSVFEKFMGVTSPTANPMFQAADMLRHLFSPYQLNFLDVNPLRDILNEIVDFDELKKISKIKLFINATNIKNGKLRVFKCNEITDKVLLASACLPYIAQTVTIDNDKYWDGGFSGNPALSPLIYDSKTSDIVVVQIIPFHFDETPINIPEIIDRVNEISFNNALLKEVDGITSVNELIENNDIKNKLSYRKINLHLIGNEEIITSLGRASKLNADWQFLTYLRDAGRQTAEDWINQNHDKIGKETTFSAV